MRVAALPFPARIGDSPRFHRNVWPFRVAPYLSPSASLVAAELTRRRTTARYRLRESGLVVHLRHPHRDVWMLDEIFHRQLYAVPPEVRRALVELGRPLRILDLGAHVGLATLFLAAEFPGAALTSFEPDPDNLAVLRRTIAANSARLNWELVAAVAACRDDAVQFVSDGHLSHIARTDERNGVVAVPARDVFPFLERADLVKIDIQGAEWELMTDPRFRAKRPVAVVLEYHPYLAPELPARSAAEILLRRAGYAVREPTDVHAGEGTLWAWRTDADPDTPPPD